MKRKHIYMWLALPLVLITIVLMLTPSSVRDLFISEFKYRAGLMIGIKPEPTGDGTRGLRLERPEEYGPQPGSEIETEETESEASE